MITWWKLRRAERRWWKDRAVRNAAHQLAVEAAYWLEDHDADR